MKSTEIMPLPRHNLAQWMYSAHGIRLDQPCCCWPANSIEDRNNRTIRQFPLFFSKGDISLDHHTSLGSVNPDMRLRKSHLHEDAKSHNKEEERNRQQDDLAKKIIMLILASSPTLGRWAYLSCRRLVWRYRFGYLGFQQFSTPYRNAGDTTHQYHSEHKPSGTSQMKCFFGTRLPVGSRSINLHVTSKGEKQIVNSRSHSRLVFVQSTLPGSGQFGRSSGLNLALIDLLFKLLNELLLLSLDVAVYVLGCTFHLGQTCCQSIDYLCHRRSSSIRIFHKQSSASILDDRHLCVHNLRAITFGRLSQIGYSRPCACWAICLISSTNTVRERRIRCRQFPACIPILQQTKFLVELIHCPHAMLLRHLVSSSQVIHIDIVKNRCPLIPNQRFKSSLLDTVSGITMNVEVIAGSRRAHLPPKCLLLLKKLFEFVNGMKKSLVICSVARNPEFSFKTVRKVVSAHHPNSGTVEIIRRAA